MVLRGGTKVGCGVPDQVILGLREAQFSEDEVQL